MCVVCSMRRIEPYFLLSHGVARVDVRGKNRVDEAALLRDCKLISSRVLLARAKSFKLSNNDLEI
jgi:hypothetical protein